MFSDKISFYGLQMTGYQGSIWLGSKNAITVKLDITVGLA